MILPKRFSERDSVMIALPYGVDGAVVPVQKFCDAQKLYAAMTDGWNMPFTVRENQAEVQN